MILRAPAWDEQCSFEVFLAHFCTICVPYPWFIGRVLITYHRQHTCLGLGLVLHGATSAHVTCKNVSRGTFPTASKAISVKEREGGPDTDLSFRQTSLTQKPDKRRARGPAHSSNEPAGSGRRTRECYSEPGPPHRTGLPETRAHQP